MKKDNFVKQPRKRISGNKLAGKKGMNGEARFDKKKFNAENRRTAEEHTTVQTHAPVAKKYTEVARDTRYDGIVLPKGSSHTHVLSKDYPAITVEGKKSTLCKGQMCLLYENGILQSADGRIAKF